VSSEQGTAPLDILAPCPGRLVAMTDVPDPVFAAEMVGPGVAIDPEPRETTVVSPIAGKVVKMLPHAFVVLGDQGVGILVHLGINTVRLEGKGFEVLATQRSTVQAGDPMVRWDPTTITDDDMSTMVIVVAMDRPKGSVAPPADDAVAEPGDVLFTLTP
jgi:glucose-specific phosphotransferase system IIA component